MALSIEATAHLGDCDLAVRLLDEGQVLAERRLVATRENDQMAWAAARKAMQEQDRLLALEKPMPLSAALQFSLVVSALFPDFGTAPEGVAS